MKFTYTLAVLALINNASAAVVRDDDDLFTDASDEKETLNSIAQAEKAHGSTFKGISVEDQQSLATQKTKMTFTKDEFVMNERRVYGSADKVVPKGSLLMLEDNMHLEPRPIGELLLEITHSADISAKVLAGAQLNDDDDTAGTLESLKAAEAISGNKMTTPDVNQDNFKNTGTEVEDFLARSHKVSTKELEDALEDKIPVNNHAQVEAAEKQKKAAEAAAAAKKSAEANKAAEKEIGIHFQADDIMDQE